uniref:DIS3-like exonuclease 1 n=1 Tax=Saccoglossus kowalevskii TaxID=10224 RepID=A0ABM0GT85_SACKO|nr:PREDICTED: DIS3-like exonuclease 1-like [Saccoglossus kowalevskii]
MIKTEKHLRVRNYRGQTVRVVREHYLREDVPCNSELCLAGCPSDGKTLLPMATHYIVPDCQVTRDYLEILELPEITGILFLQTVLHSVLHHGNRRSYNNIRKMVKDPRQQCTIFANEYCHYAYCERQPGELLKEWQLRSVYEAAVWYYNHLAGQVSIVMITEDQEFIAKFAAKTRQVFLLTMQEYLKTFWPTLSNALDIYESLSASLSESTVEKDTTKGYKEYLPQEILSAGIKSGRYIQGCVHVNKHRPQREAFVQRAGGGMKESGTDSDIIISGMLARNRAVDGDIVAVELLPKSQWVGKIISLTETHEGIENTEAMIDSSNVMPTGRVIGILQRNWRDYVASFSADKENKGNTSKAGKVLVIPWDYRIPKIRISTRQSDSLGDHRVIVRIDSWPVDSQYPNGHFVQTLGSIGKLETEISSILVENSISIRSFSEGQIKELPSNSSDDPWTIDPEEVARRQDLRDSHLIFSIDPKGCEDVDDTLSVRQLPNGNIELGVHIADVSYFVKPNSLTDLEAKSRATTVYLADRRYDMLPPILSADLCSLIGGEDRYAMSVLWQLSPNYDVIDVWYGRTVIRSAYKMFYEAAQALHDGKDVRDDIPELEGLDEEVIQERLRELNFSISTLMSIARHLKSKRESGGAVQLEGLEIQVQLSDKKDIQDLVPKQALEIHETIAECMIFANHWVAKKITEAFPSFALLRHHPLPRQEHFENLLYCAKSKGFSVDTSTNKNLADSLDRCVDEKNPIFNKLLRTLATYAMSNALYFSTGSLSRDQFYHYGLALDRYTHFTSPIRRYADIIVHRLLMAAIKEDEENLLLGNKELQDLCDHINHKNRAAQHAQRASQELFQALYFKDRDPNTDESCVVDAVIFGLRTNGVLVFIPRYRARISVAASHAHTSMTRFDLVASVPYCSNHKEENATQRLHEKTDIVQEVTRDVKQEVAISTEINDELGSDFNELKSKYGQTKDHCSIYSLLQQFKEMGLEEES